MRPIFSENQVRRLIARCHTADQRAWAEEVGKVNPDGDPRRYFLLRLPDNGSYVLPMKQSAIKDARLMPGTRVMLALLTGWAGTGRPIELTQGTIAKHLQRSIKQVARYLRDARREGYLTYRYRKNRLGMITGIIIDLSFNLLRPELKRKQPAPAKFDRTYMQRPANPAKPARTYRTDNNTFIKDSSYLYPDASAATDRLRKAAQFLSARPA